MDKLLVSDTQPLLARMAEDREVLAEVWAGRVPAVFSLAEEDWRGEGRNRMTPAPLPPQLSLQGPHLTLAA